MSAFILKFTFQSDTPHLVHNKDITAQANNTKKSERIVANKSKSQNIIIAIRANHGYDFFKWL